MTGPSAEITTSMKVLFFSSYVSHESGASHAMRETIRRVAARGLQPIVVVPNCEGSKQMFPGTEFDVVYLNIERPRKTRNPLVHARFFLSSLPTLLALRRIIRQREIDVVHFNEITDFLAGIAGWFCGKPCVCHVRADGISNLHRRLLILLLKRVADAVIVPSKSTAAWIRGEDDELAGKTRLIYDHAFDMREYDGPTSGAAFRAECGFSPDDFLVILVSKLVAPKGHECFIRAAERVLNVSPGIRFAIVGGTVPGHDDEAFKIRSLAKQLAPTPGLRMVGHRMDLPAVYAACDIAVHCPVFPDTYPTVVLLAMTAGKPIIGSATGGIVEQIDNGNTGLLVAVNDPDALAQAVLDLARDPDRCKSLGAAARKKVREEFAPETQARLLLEVYADVVGRVGALRTGCPPVATALPKLSEQSKSET
jgi:glycosyltransferase involved in cell wall biosynthesis